MHSKLNIHLDLQIVCSLCVYVYTNANSYISSCLNAQFTFRRPMVSCQVHCNQVISSTIKTWPPPCNLKLLNVVQDIFKLIKINVKHNHRLYTFLLYICLIPRVVIFTFIFFWSSCSFFNTWIGNNFQKHHVLSIYKYVFN